MRDYDLTNALTLAGIIVGVLTGHPGVVIGAILFCIVVYMRKKSQ